MMCKSVAIKRHSGLSSRGFTLIELLVVISIIGILASVTFASLRGALSRARDARRISELRQIRMALEVYYAANGAYPNPGWGWRSECSAWGGFAANDVIPGLVPAYMGVFPSDPLMNKADSTSCYLYLSNGTDYALLDHNGPEINYLGQPALVDPTRDSGSNGCVVDGTGIWSWKVSSPGGVCW